ncbi:ATP-dependent DNA helicase PIF1-like [Montipora capricornis]|uniref:ATP-dependent DNA helicase PIF1-like n=1 Tax=Montipora capricornis TaxID=246305 RepID=UPI0035F11D1A
MQKLAYNIITKHSENTSLKEPLLLIINGVAGTGKSYLIRALTSYLQRKCVITATTGKAAYSIRGVTIHSLLKLPITPQSERDLSGEALIELQHRLCNVDYILIDEYSMLGQKTLGWIDRRCRQSSGVKEHLFGGKSIILIGDPAQLPPVGDKPFGETSENDWKLLLTRQPLHANNIEQFKTATRLFYTNEQVANYNYDSLLQLKQPIAKIDAKHSSSEAAKISPQDMYGLELSLLISQGALVMLTMNLWPSVGLCNGSAGTVVDIIYKTSHQPPDLPIAVIIKFDDYIGPSISNKIPSLVAIAPVTISNSGNSVHERQQLPLKIAWALTIHKSQGLTLPQAWVDIGKSEQTLGITYVAFSRVKQLSSLIVQPMTFDRLKSINKSANLKYRQEGEHRLKQKSETTTCFFQQ